MALATRPTVEIGFDLTLAGQGDFFTIGDATKGQLNDATYVLAGGDILQDVTQYVRSISIRRGRRRETQDVDAGALTVELDNRLRVFDPDNVGNIFDDPYVTFNDPVATFDGLGEGSPYALDIEPRKEIQVTAGNSPLFVGLVEDWDLQFNLNGDHVALAKCSDAFSFLARQTVPAGTASVETTGARIGSVLDDLEWPNANRDIDTGVNTLGADTIPDNQEAIPYLQKAARSELGAFFTNRLGQLVFRDRDSVQVATGVRFSTDGLGIPFRNIEIEYGTESLYNSVSVEYVGGTVTATDATSEADYGPSDFTLQTLLSTSGAATNIADSFIDKFSTPVTRIRSIEVVYDSLTAEQRGIINALEISDLITVDYDPGYGRPISRQGAIDQIEHSITAGRWTTVIRISESLGGFIIGTSLLDEGVAGF